MFLLCRQIVVKSSTVVVLSTLRRNKDGWLKKNIQVVFERDPAVRVVWKLFFVIQFHAIILHRLAHKLQ